LFSINGAEYRQKNLDLREIEVIPAWVCGTHPTFFRNVYFHITVTTLRTSNPPVRTAKMRIRDAPRLGVLW